MDKPVSRMTQDELISEIDDKLTKSILSAKGTQRGAVVQDVYIPSAVNHLAKEIVRLQRAAKQGAA